MLQVQLRILEKVTVMKDDVIGLAGDLKSLVPTATPLKGYSVGNAYLGVGTELIANKMEMVNTNVKVKFMAGTIFLFLQHFGSMAKLFVSKIWRVCNNYIL